MTETGNLATSYPTGVRPLLISETARRRRIESRFVEVLERAGFAEVVLPIIDYVEPYAALGGPPRQSYRFVDRQGDLVAIRSDFTPMLARALAPSLDSTQLPLRLFYRGDVIRCEASRLGVNRELFQIGAEIVGDPSVEADITMLRLAADLVRAFNGVPSLVYNDVSIAAALDGGAREALQTKRVTPATPAVVRRMITGEATLDDVASFAPGAAARLRAIERALPQDEIALHLDDVEEDAGYYSGLRFRVYGGSSRARVAQGGRYDRLYERFGTPAPAIGFTFTIDDLD